LRDVVDVTACVWAAITITLRIRVIDIGDRRSVWREIAVIGIGADPWKRRFGQAIRRAEEKRRALGGRRKCKMARVRVRVWEYDADHVSALYDRAAEVFERA
jgi:hypothetical protein